MRRVKWLSVSGVLLFLLAASCDDSTGIPMGSEGGACYGNGTCDAGLECNAQNICVESTTVDGCGNGVIDAGEECDDGNLANGDGCNLRCKHETSEPERLEEPYYPPGTTAEDVPVAMTECTDETTTGSYAPGPTIDVNVCVYSYLDGVGNGYDDSEVRSDMAAAQGYYDQAGTAINLNLVHVDVLTGTAAQTDPEGSEITALLNDLRTDADADHPGACDVVVGYANSLDGIGGRGTWPSAGLHTCVVKAGNGPSGYTAAHEIGHVFGLYHTHQSNEGCSDTPSDDGCWEDESGCSAQCPNTTDTPAENVMSYYFCDTPSTDSFTDCQTRRTRCFITKMFYECVETATGQITSPASGSSFGGDFNVSGSVQDLDGIDVVSIAIDTLPDCRFRLTGLGGVTSYNFDITVQPDHPDCQLTVGTHTAGLWVADSCGGAELVDTIQFEIEDSPVDCTSGVCCDTSTNTYRSSSYVCQTDADDEYGCPWGTSPGDDVGIHYRDRYCSGNSSSCDGNYGSWGTWQAHDNCNSSEGCDSGSGTCVTTQCTSGVCCDTSTNTYRSSSYVCQTNADSEYGCPWGTSAGDDVGIHYRDMYCSGSSSTCNGSYGSWGSWQVHDNCSPTEACQQGSTSCHPICTATNRWNPTSDIETDDWGQQETQSINVPISVEVRENGLGLEVQVCKVGDTFNNGTIRLELYDGATNSTCGLFSDLNTSSGVGCTAWYNLVNDTGYTEGEQFGGIWKVVSPASSAGDWSGSSGCSLTGGSQTGTCWNGISITLTRTCL